MTNIKNILKIRAKQRLWGVLGWLLIWFNDPFHVLVIFKPSYFGWIFEMICTTTFIIFFMAYLENSFYMLKEEIYRKH